MKPQTTLKKIAHHLNLSISTVSRALKDHPDVSPDTIRRVKDLANMMDYEPNAFAVNLRKKHSNIFAIIVPELSGFFYNSFVEAVEEKARQIGYNIMILQSREDPIIEAENLKLCRYNHVAGVFAALTRHTIDYAGFDKTIAAEIPVVFFDKVPPQEHYHTACIADREAGMLAAQQLLMSGKKRLLLVLGNPNLSITRRRQEGLHSVFDNFTDLSIDTLHAESTSEAFEQVMKLSPVYLEGLAIFCMSDELLCGCMQALYHYNMAIPRQVSLLSMSNGFFPQLFYPNISYVETSGYQLGLLSFEIMESLHRQEEVLHANMLQCFFKKGHSL
jgi:LacI family transcriptional regulator